MKLRAFLVPPFLPQLRNIASGVLSQKFMIAPECVDSTQPMLWEFRSRSLLRSDIIGDSLERLDHSQFWIKPRIFS